jgi:hypothetical protein
LAGSLTNSALLEPLDAAATAGADLAPVVELGLKLDSGSPIDPRFFPVIGQVPSE